MSDFNEYLMKREISLMAENAELRKRVEVAEDEYLQQILVTESWGEKYEVMKAERDIAVDALERIVSEFRRSDLDIMEMERIAAEALKGGK